MQASEIPQYIANILLIGKAGGSPLREAIVENICRQISAGHSDLAAANQLVSDGLHQLTPVGRYSERVQNLEDLMLVAMAEGYLEEGDKLRILAFAKNIGVNQAQMRSIAQEAKNRLTLEKPQMQCPACGAPNHGQNKFCPSCGNNLQSRGSGDDWQIPNKGVCVEFPADSQHPKAAALARGSRQYQQALRGGRYWHLACWPREKLAEALPLLELLQDYSERRAWLDGKPMAWEELFGFVPCALQRQNAYRPEAYCFGLDEQRLNLWGCRQAGMDWEEGAEWFSYGQFEEFNVFVFDKNELRHALDKNLRLHRHCPFLRIAKIEQAIQQLPARVAVSAKTGWQYLEIPHETPRCLTLPADNPDSPETPPRYVIGVVPQGFSEARKIVLAVFPESQIRRLLQPLK
jgi:Zn finger protein HypA/HybF involved in hydrogenase expression